MRVAVLWTGGKDSCMALHQILNQGHKADSLITFIGDRPFLCHPISLMSMQSLAIGIDHLKIKISAPFFQNYREAIKAIVKERSLEGIVTGDIDVVDSFHGPWMDDVCRGLDLELMKPLWHIDRMRYLENIMSEGVEFVFSCVNKKFFDKSWLGRIMDKTCLNDLICLNRKFGIDLAGEGGEYHTMVLNSPRFKRSLELGHFEAGETESLIFMKSPRLSWKNDGCSLKKKR
jgi:diphthine-ammonia ligase